MDIQQLWQAVLGELELTLSKANFTTWFKNTGISSIEGHKAEIIVPNTFTKAWLEKKYHHDILKALQNITENKITEVAYKVENINNIKQASTPVASGTENTSTEPTASVQSVVRPQTASTIRNHPTAPRTPYSKQAVPSAFANNNEFGINPKYSFNTFVVGKSNELAHAASWAVSDKPGETYNPLFIYGGVGLGKTHLMQAIGHELRIKNPKIKILYASCEKFTNDYINMVKTGRAQEFQDRYRSVDLLLVDDIQFITGKEGTQEAFFHTFNTLHQKNKQIIITSDRPPKAIQGIESRLLSRFEWGMIADVQNPDLEMRIAILERKCKEKNYDLSTDITNYIAANVQSNIRELEGALNRVIAHHQLQGLTPSLEGTKSILSTLTSSYHKKSLTPKQVVRTVCEFYDIRNEDIVGSSRKRELVIPRQIVMFLMREEIQSSYPAIGQELGGRDHTTAMHAYEKIKREKENNEKIRQEINLIKQRLYNN